MIVEPELQGAITLDRARAITVSAAKAWTEAPCTRTKGGLNSPTIRLVDVDEARCNGGPLGTAAATKNEIRFRGSEPPKPGTLAVTTNVFVPASGLTNEASMAVYKSQIFDAYAKDPNGQEQTFAAVVRHEMGHFLGLAHSDQKTAIMYAYYQSSPAPGLTDDDLAAICDAYDPTAPVGDGCAVSSGATHDSGANLTPVVVVAAIALASFKGRAARRRALGLLRHRPKNP